MADLLPDSAQRDTVSRNILNGQQRYLVLSSPQETPIDVDDAYDGVVCLGDLLQFAPPPGSDPTGSVIAQFEPTIERAYETGATDTILETIRSLADRRDVKQAAHERYDEFLGTFETNVYYIAGNQDFPDALTAVADAHEHVSHASTLSDACAIDGAVPSFAPFPSDTFPGECARNEFYRRLEESAASVLFAHALPAEFDASEYGFELALGARDDVSVPAPTSNTVVELSPYLDTERTAVLTIPDTGAERTPVLKPKSNTISSHDHA